MYLMENLRLRNASFPNVSTCAIPLPFSGFFEKCGATWMLTCAFLYSSLQLALMYVQYSKGLDVVQTAFAVKKYKSHRRVGLPSDIIASM
jgi:hypothetical protein